MFVMKVEGSIPVIKGDAALSGLVVVTFGGVTDMVSYKSFYMLQETDGDTQFNGLYLNEKVSRSSFSIHNCQRSSF